MKGLITNRRRLALADDEILIDVCDDIEASYANGYIEGFGCFCFYPDLLSNGEMFACGPYITGVPRSASRFVTAAMASLSVYNAKRVIIAATMTIDMGSPQERHGLVATMYYPGPVTTLSLCWGIAADGSLEVPRIAVSDIECVD